MSCIALCLCETKKLETPASPNSQAQDWTPVTGERGFSVNVNDKIQGASQLRHETWKDGVVNGYYAAPTREGKWLKVTYQADDKGYKVLS